MIEVINLEKLSNDGYKQPANDPNESTPDNITHAQLRYNTFTSSYVIQGVAVTGSSSTFEFTIAPTLGYSLFKLYTSTDGTTYTENKSYGGSLGKTLSPSTFGTSMKIIVNQSATSSPTVKTLFNNTAYTIPTKTRNATGDYTLTFSGNIFGDTSKISLEYKTILFDNGSIASAIDIPNTGLSNNTMNIQTYLFSQVNGPLIDFVAADSVLTQYVITINIEP